MNKSELSRMLAVHADLHENEAVLFVDIMFSEMKNALLAGNRVEIRGFGSFKIKKYKSYAGRNPKTGEPVTVEPKILPFFKAGRELREYINED